MRSLPLILACLFLAVPCESRTITVDDDGPADFNSVQGAINDANDGDTVLVYEGRYYENIDFRGKAITVTSLDPNDPNVVDATIIDANADEPDDIVVSFHMGEGPNSVLAGFTITGGNAQYGGGITCWTGCSPTISDCKIVGNTATESGGGIYCFESSNATIANCAINDNSATYGGGMCNYSSSPTATGCIFSGNSADGEGYGGGMYNTGSSSPTVSNCTFRGNIAGFNAGGMCNRGSGSSPAVKDCTFSGNIAAQYGGGMCNQSSSNPAVSNCTFRGNIAGFNGGGMCNRGSNPLVTNCNFTGNAAVYYGGGMCNQSGSNPTVTNSKFSGNTADEHGGGIHCSGGEGAPTFSNCTFSGNSAHYGGAICSAHQSSPVITNSIVANSISGGGIYATYSNPVLSYNDVWGNVGGDYTGWAWSGVGDISVDPCFVDPGHWQDPCNTPTDPSDDIWIDGDYHLQSQAGRWDPSSQTWVIDANHSLCIDAGDPNDPNWPAELWPHGKRINMGAYGGTPEAGMSLSTAGNIADLDDDGDVDYVDLDLFTDEWTCELLLLAEDVDRNGVTNFLDFAILADNWLWQE